MTLVLSVNGRDSIWIVADRLLCKDGKKVREDAIKLMCLDTKDATAILGYAGLGATAGGTQPAEWMSATLRGYNVSFDQSLQILGNAMHRRFPVPLAALGQTTHSILIPALVENNVHAYSMDIRVNDDGTCSYEYGRHLNVRANAAVAPPTRLCARGSGASILDRDRRWMRALLRVVSNYEDKRFSAQVVADELASINREVSARIPLTVGPECIVVWRNRRGFRNGDGGGHLFYNKLGREKEMPTLPTLSCGVDLSALCDAVTPFEFQKIDRRKAGEPVDDLERKAENAIGNLPTWPDDRLR